MRTVTTRQFLRGGFASLRVPVLVMTHSRPRGIWVPYVDGRLQVPDPRTASQLERLVSDRAITQERAHDAGQDVRGFELPDDAGGTDREEVATA